MKKTTDAVEMFNKSAEVYQERYMDVSAYSKFLNQFCEELKNAATVLEFGCGPGNITRYLLNKREDLKIFGSDLAPEMIRLAKKNCPEAEFEIVDIRNLTSITSKYDGIIAGFCLPYLTKEEVVSFFNDIVKLLNPKGIIYLSAIQNENEESEVKTSSSGDSIRIHYYKKSFLKSLLGNNGLRVLDSFDLTKNDDNEVVFIARFS